MSPCWRTWPTSPRQAMLIELGVDYNHAQGNGSEHLHVTSVLGTWPTSPSDKTGAS